MNGIDHMILNTVAVVLVMPIGSQLPNMQQQKYRNRFYREAKKAFVNGQKCWMVAIDIGNGDFSYMFEGLTTQFVSFSLFVGQTARKINYAEERMMNFESMFNPIALTLAGYNQEHPDLSWGTFTGKNYLHFFLLKD